MYCEVVMAYLIREKEEGTVIDSKQSWPIDWEGEESLGAMGRRGESWCYVVDVLCSQV